MSRPVANLVLLLAGAIWGMGFIAQSTAMDSVGPFLFIGLRFLVACVFIAPFAWFEARKASAPVRKSDLYGFVLIGLALLLGMGLQQFGLLLTTVTNSGFLTGLYVVMVPILSLVLLRQVPHPVVWPAVVLAFSGIWLLSGGDLVALNTGDFLTIACALAWSAQVILIGRYASGSGRPIALSLVQFAICAILGLFFATALEDIVLTDIMAAVPEILFAGIFGSGVAFTLQVVGQRYTTASQAAIFLSTEALFAAVFAAILLGERIPPIGYLGGVLIFLAILIVEIGPAILRRNRRSMAKDF